MSTIRARAQAADGKVTVRALITHPMETGARRDGSGNTVPAHYIETVEAKVGDRTVMTAFWGPGISRNPFYQFEFNGAAGEQLVLSWTDNKGESDSAEVSVG
ncbi:MAG: thiosulfate oxidation carrier complex protein SoxZ [Thioalkalivibrionaceae bacterium]